jgi:hypothetical protein
MSSVRECLLVLGALICLASPSRACDDQLPEELRALRQEAGCSAIQDFYDRLGFVDPPYLYGYLPGAREESAAFWCIRKGADQRYLLVLVEKHRIASTVPWDMYPGGLSLNDSSGIPLSEFVYVDDPKKGTRPPGKQTEFAPLRSEYDGVVTLFYRDGDRWLYRVLH